MKARAWCWLLLVLLLGALPAGVRALPVAYHCAPAAPASPMAPVADLPTQPTTAWTPAPDGRVPVLRRDQVCWLRLEASAPAPRFRLQFDRLHMQRVDIELLSAQGDSLGLARRVGGAVEAWVSGQQALFLLQPQPGQVLYARVSPVPGSLPFPGVDPHLVVDWVDPGPATLDAQWTDLVNMGAVVFLFTSALVALFFLFALGESNYGIYALYATVQAFTHFSKTGLGFALEVGQWWWVNAALQQYLVSALSAWLYVRFGRFEVHSPWLAKAGYGVMGGFLVLTVLPWLGWGHVGWPVFVLLPLHFAVALWGNLRGWLRGERTCGILLVGLGPIAVYWLVYGVYVVVLRQPTPAALEFGSHFDLVRTLVLPAVFCWGLAERTLSAQRETTHLLSHDPLTGLLNREGLRDLGDRLMAHGHAPTVTVANIERFHAINETLGMAQGDRVLMETGRRLAACAATVGPGHVARMHADQFGLMFENAPAPERVHQALQEAFTDAADVAVQIVDLSLVCGTAQWVQGQDMATLIRNAEVALDAARAQKRPWLLYTPGLENQRQVDLSLVSALRRAVQHNELRMYLQPKIALADGQLCGAEALVRWEHPTRGMVPPSDFVPFAESTGRIASITQWMLRQAMLETVHWRQQGQPLKIAVNLSTHDLSDADLPERLRRLLADTGALAQDIRLEVTESAAMQDPQTSLTVMGALDSAGFSLSIDDFGTGYSSLAHLQKMPVAELKVDRAFVRDIHLSSDAVVLLESIIAMGHRLGLTVVAEGAESIHEWRLLQTLGCDVAQGWFAAKPMPAHDLRQWASRHLPFRPAPPPS